MIIEVYFDVYVITNFIIILLINLTLKSIMKEKVNMIMLTFNSLTISLIMSYFTIVSRMSTNKIILIALALIVYNTVTLYNINILCKHNNMIKIIKISIYTMIITMIYESSLYTLINLKHKYTIFVLFSSFFITYIIIKIIKIRIKKLVTSSLIYDTEISILDKTISTKCFIDTGNTITYMSRNINFINENVITKSLHNIDAEDLVIDQIECNTINGISMIKLLECDSIKIINYEGGDKVIRKPILGICKDKMTFKDGYEMIISPKMFL